jgi:hypothetical protein
VLSQNRLVGFGGDLLAGGGEIFHFEEELLAMPSLIVGMAALVRTHRFFLPLDCDVTSPPSSGNV